MDCLSVRGCFSQFQIKITRYIGTSEGIRRIVNNWININPSKWKRFREAYV